MLSKLKPGAHFISAREAARQIGKSHTWVASLVKAGKIPGAQKIGRSILIPVEWVEKLLFGVFLR